MSEKDNTTKVLEVNGVRVTVNLYVSSIDNGWVVLQIDTDETLPDVGGEGPQLKVYLNDAAVAAWEIA